MVFDLLKFNNNTAIIDEYGDTLSYGVLSDLSDSVCRNMERRSLVFSMCTNTIGSAVGYISFLNHEIVPMMLSAHLEREFILNLLDLYMPSYIWCPVDMTDVFSYTERLCEAYNYALLKLEWEEKYAIYDRLALLLTTSGSTGSPKFVRQSYENIVSNALAIVKYLELDSSERPITTLPMNYTYGLSIINSHLMVGATLLITDKSITQKEFWNFLRDEKATSFGGVPYTYEMLDRMRFMRMDLSSLKTMTQAGGKLSPELHEKFAEYAKEKGKRFYVMYGQCEATARMAYLPYEKSLEKKGAMGVAIPGGSFELIDVDGTIITEPDIAGELVYKGPNVTLGYAESGNDLIKGDERGGILETGDLARYDEDGYYYIVGRKKRFLKIFGNRVNLDEVDMLIKDEFGIDVTSGGVDDNMSIFITDASYAERVKEYVVNATKLNHSAFKVTVIPEIPKNDAGKVLYKELEKYY
jgi:acyl-coenzyme A synthetase/AMP-(fatty) acid ligase